MMNNLYKELSKEMDITLSISQIQKFEKYYEFLVERNKHMNLTGITDHKEVIIKHFFDSLTCIKTEINFKNSKIIDIGTGAGFPGMPLKIFYENCQMNLLDSLNKRIIFLKELSSIISVENINFFHGRAEEYGQNKNHREKYDIVVSRAVADLGVLSEYAIPFLKFGGYFIAQKSVNSKDEIEKSKSAIKILGGEIENVQKVKIPGIDRNNFLVKIRKIKETPSKYPRRPGKPSKNSL